MPFVGDEDQFEDEYAAKFRALAASHGLIIKYEKDLAGIDVGVHLYDPKAEGKKSTPLSLRRAWFQLKGKHASTISAAELATAQMVSISKIKLDSLRFWYAQPEPVYMAVYLEATNEFLIEDIQTIVDRQWGDSFLKVGTFKAGQQEVTVQVRRAAVLSDDVWTSMQSAAPTMRVDGPQWRGRPLGHRFDPLRSALAPMAPADYRALAKRLLAVHGYETQSTLDTTGLYEAGNQAAVATLTVGRMHYTYEWTHPLFTEFGYDPGETFRIEGDPMFAQGKVAVLVHDGQGLANQERMGELALEVHELGIDQLLVFTNTGPSSKVFGSYFAGAKPLRCVPQDLSSLAFNVLTATTVFLEFRDRIEWDYVTYL